MFSVIVYCQLKLSWEAKYGGKLSSFILVLPMLNKGLTKHGGVQVHYFSRRFYIKDTPPQIFPNICTRACHARLSSLYFSAPPLFKIMTRALNINEE